MTLQINALSYLTLISELYKVKAPSFLRNIKSSGFYPFSRNLFTQEFLANLGIK